MSREASKYVVDYRYASMGSWEVCVGYTINLVKGRIENQESYHGSDWDIFVDEQGNKIGPDYDTEEEAKKVADGILKRSIDKFYFFVETVNIALDREWHEERKKRDKNDI